MLPEVLVAKPEEQGLHPEIWGEAGLEVLAQMERRGHLSQGAVQALPVMLSEGLGELGERMDQALRVQPDLESFQDMCSFETCLREINSSTAGGAVVVVLRVEDLEEGRVVVVAPVVVVVA